MTANQLKPSELYEALIKNRVSYFCGVPDSLLSSFSFYLENHAKKAHDIAVNEGNAIALAVGYYLATEETPLVYMQNSGLGNAINPLVSLADPLVMGIPIILLIGWRGQEGKIDEPQHKKQGLITTKLLKDLGIPYEILSTRNVEVFRQVTRATEYAHENKSPFALLVEPNTLPSFEKKDGGTKSSLNREEVIKTLVDSLNDTDIVVATTGKASRELYEHREATGQKHAQDLLVVGGMGHASGIALAIAQQQSVRKVYCIDGDGALLMHMGAVATIGRKGLKNFYHFVINNGAHESVGGQPTVGLDVNMPAIAKACGYRHTIRVSSKDLLLDTLKRIEKLDGPVFIEVRVNSKSRTELSRPTIHPSKNKEAFMRFMKES